MLKLWVHAYHCRLNCVSGDLALNILNWNFIFVSKKSHQGCWRTCSDSTVGGLIMFGVACNLFWATFVNTRYIFWMYIVFGLKSAQFLAGLSLCAGIHPTCLIFAEMLNPEKQMWACTNRLATGRKWNVPVFRVWTADKAVIRVPSKTIITVVGGGRVGMTCWPQQHKRLKIQEWAVSSLPFLGPMVKSKSNLKIVG